MTTREEVKTELESGMPEVRNPGPAPKFTPGQGGWLTNGGDIAGLKGAARGVMALASGGQTEKVVNAAADAPAQAESELRANDLETVSPEDFEAMLAAADPENSGQVTLVRTPSGWVPQSKTSALGSTGKDPAAVRAAFSLQGQKEAHGVNALEAEQEADAAQYAALRQVQQNETKAIQEFKQRSDALNNRYELERENQMQRLLNIQQAMDKVPDAPRTIREKLARSGTEDRLRFGLAAAFSVLGGAVARDGGAGVQQLLNNVQANIDREVEREREEYKRLGDRAQMSQNIYANLRQNMQDDRVALNITKAMYYDAVENTIKQIALQYKMDMQAPAVIRMQEGFANERQKLVLDTASVLQDQSSATDRYQVGGVVAVGAGGNPAKQYKTTDLEKAAQSMSKELDERGFNAGERAIGLWQKAIKLMQDTGFKPDQKFYKALAMLSDANPSSIKQVAGQFLMDGNETKILSLIIQANKEQLKDTSGKAVTAHELAKDVLEKGGYSPGALDQARRVVAYNREQIYKGVARGYHPDVWSVVDARNKVVGVTRPHAGIGTDPAEPIDRSDLAARVEGRLHR